MQHTDKSDLRTGMVTYTSHLTTTERADHHMPAPLLMSDCSGTQEAAILQRSGHSTNRQKIRSDSTMHRVWYRK